MAADDENRPAEAAFIDYLRRVTARPNAQRARAIDDGLVQKAKAAGQ